MKAGREGVEPFIFYDCSELGGAAFGGEVGGLGEEFSLAPLENQPLTEIWRRLLFAGEVVARRGRRGGTLYAEDKDC